MLGVLTTNILQQQEEIAVHFDSIDYGNGARGGSDKGYIRLYLRNIDSIIVAEQTIIHEATHLRFNIGECQHAEAICFAFEKMHKENRTYLTPEEWDKMVALAKSAYPDYNWEEGGYGDYEQFNFVRRKAP